MKPAIRNPHTILLALLLLTLLPAVSPAHAAAPAEAPARIADAAKVSGTAEAEQPARTAGPEQPDAPADSLFAAAYRQGYEAGYRDGRGNRRPRNARRAAASATASATRSATASPATPAAPETLAASAAQGPLSPVRDTSARRIMHRLGAEFRPAYIFPTNSFVQGANRSGRPIDLALSGHLRYGWQYRPGSRLDRLFGGVYQGVGLAYFDFGTPDELGNPVALYLYQGARIARLGRRLSLDYEWNLGLSFGWKPYDAQRNPDNRMMGSKINAYIGIDCFLRWHVLRDVDITAGVALNHFSNGNTKYPNAGLNSIGLKTGIVCLFGRTEAENAPQRLRIPFPRHMSYDLTLFGSWRRKGIAVDDRQIASPEAYAVAGFNFAAMYNFGYKFRAGLSLDGVYDRSANITLRDQIVPIDGSPELITDNPGFARQAALGLSARGEFVMPYFSVGLGLGVNVLHRGGDMKGFYQMLTLKIAATRSSYVHIGYSLRNFHQPNFLMLGIGYRSNNRYPRLR